MSPLLAELCFILIQTTFGDLAAQIFSIVSTGGRLPLETIHQLSQTRLRRVKVALATLIQHGIVLHYAEEFEDDPTFFSVDWNSAYNLVRHDKLIRLVESREGEAAGQLVSTILHHGLSNIGHLAAEYDLAPGSKRDSGVETTQANLSDDDDEDLPNGVGEQAQTVKMTISTFHATLRTLLVSGILVKVNDRTFIPPDDLEEEIRETVIMAEFRDRKITGSKKGPLFKTAVNNLKRKYREEDTYSDTRDIGSYGEIKRSDPLTSSNKRLKSDHLTNGDHEEANEEQLEEQPEDVRVDKLPNDMVVRVDFERFKIIMRNQKLAKSVESEVGSVTGSVYAALLQAVEGQVQPLRDPRRRRDELGQDDDSDSDDDEDKDNIKAKEKEDNKEDDDDDGDEDLPTTSSVDLDKYLDKGVDLASGIKQVVPASKLINGTGHHSKKPLDVADSNEDDDNAQLGIKQEPHSDSEDEPDTEEAKSIKERRKRLNLIDTHLLILDEHPKEYCEHLPDSPTTSVDFSTLSQTLIQSEIDDMILARYGKKLHRVVRILRYFEKLDDAQIAKRAMLETKSLHAQLSLLQYHGLLEWTELAKDEKRVPVRASYLWSFDEERVRDRFVQTCYQGMSRCLQRLEDEREGRFRRVIQKAEQLGLLVDGVWVKEVTEIKGLSELDKKMFRQCKEVEERLLVQVERLDDVVAVLRDCCATDTSLMV